MTPPSILFAQLAEAKLAGLAFDDAWPTSLAIALHYATRTERREWREVFREQEQTVWRAAYEGEQEATGARALRAGLAVLEDSWEAQTTLAAGHVIA